MSRQAAARTTNVTSYMFDKGDLMKAFVRAIKAESPGCHECQSPDNKMALEFHHRDPREKVASIGSMLRQPTRYNLTDIMNEVAKCDLVCNPCHKQIHKRWQVITGQANRNPMFTDLANDR